MKKMYTFEEILADKGYLVYTNVGYSMMPLLRQRRDIIEIHAKDKERCKKYDVVLYKRGSHYILHRIIKVLPDGYVIAGDNNTFVERDIKDDMIFTKERTEGGLNKGAHLLPLYSSHFWFFRIEQYRC